AANCNPSSHGLKLWFRHSEEGVRLVHAANYVQLRTRSTSVLLEHSCQAVHVGGRCHQKTGPGARHGRRAMCQVSHRLRGNIEGSYIREIHNADTRIGEGRILACNLVTLLEGFIGNVPFESAAKDAVAGIEIKVIGHELPLVN